MARKASDAFGSALDEPQTKKFKADPMFPKNPFRVCEDEFQFEQLFLAIKASNWPNHMILHHASSKRLHITQWEMSGNVQVQTAKRKWCNWQRMERTRITTMMHLMAQQNPPTSRIPTT